MRVRDGLLRSRVLSSISIAFGTIANTLAPVFAPLREGSERASGMIACCGGFSAGTCLEGGPISYLSKDS